MKTNDIFSKGVYIMLNSLFNKVRTLLFKSQELPMDLLISYLDDADFFSLSCTYTGNSISKSDAKYCLHRLREKHRTYLKPMYQKIFIRYRLKKFDSLARDITLEVKKYAKKKRSDLDFDPASFTYTSVVDTVGKNALYNTPYDFFREFYYLIGHELDVNDRLIDMMENSEEGTDYESVLADPSYALLKEHMFHHEISYSTHCRESHELQLTMYFGINEDTIEWLLQFADPYHLEGLLQDLAFYRGKDLIYSSDHTARQQSFFL